MRSSESEGLVCKIFARRRLGGQLVDCLFRGMPQPLDLVLDHQLPAFQLGDFQVICTEMEQRFVQFSFEKLVFAFQFNEMGLYCHSHSSSVETSDSIRTAKCTPDRKSVDGNRKSAFVIFSELSVTNREYGTG